MSIKTLLLANYIQKFTVTNADKLLYGEIYSPFSLIKKMFNLFNPSVFSNKEAKWLDTGAGTGYFGIILFNLLNEGLMTTIIDEEERKTHIINNMLYFIEIKKENLIILKELFGSNANIIDGDFLSYNPTTIPLLFDYIIGNPPYNAHGMKKVPTNIKREKKQDGQTIWPHFIKKALTLLKPTVGQLCYIVPSIWMKPDKAGLYNLLSRYQIEKLHCLTNTETNQLFKGEAQTPTCYFLLTNKIVVDTVTVYDNTINLYDKQYERYITYQYTLGTPLPLFGQKIIQQIQPFLFKAGGSLAPYIIKTNMPSKSAIFSHTFDAIHFPYPNIKTTLLHGSQPVLGLNYSTLPQAYAHEIKLILAHKMYGFPYLDSEGTYGISNRDNYIILEKTKTREKLNQLKAFLSTKFALYVYEATRYRMKYLEKYAFELLPDITNLPDFPLTVNLNDKTVAEYFGLGEEDQLHIQAIKNYGYF